MRIYIAGPITGYEDLNRPAFAAAAALIRAQGHRVYSPTEFCADIEGDYQACMRRCLSCLLEADAIALLPGWEQSRGAKVEFAVADILHMTAFSVVNGELQSQYTEDGAPA